MNNVDRGSQGGMNQRFPSAATGCFFNTIGAKRIFGNALKHWRAGSSPRARAAVETYGEELREQE
jgi:hypothetical protein